MARIYQTKRVQIIRGGAYYNLNIAEQTVLEVLKKKSPYFTSAEILAKETLITEDHLRKILSILRPLATMEGCLIENQAGRGYRLLRIQSYEFI